MRFVAFIRSCVLIACMLTTQIVAVRAQGAPDIVRHDIVPVPAAHLPEQYLPMLQHRKVGLLINQTSLVGQRSLLDTLLSLRINVTRIFVPEHGFRGTADAGAHVANSTDSRSGLPVISLYGNNRKPSEEQLRDVDVLVYDLQDVGARFYTYISTLQYAMEACAQYDKTLLILDRPNPNGHYVDGPVLDTALRSFVGMQPIPIVYGMTAAEYARMLVGERWFPNADRLRLQYVLCRDYGHRTPYKLPVAPSPNLKNMAAVYLYPNLCLFEGTVVSLGRGTDRPFQQWGHPDFKEEYAGYYFVPKSMPGAAKPVLEGKKCYGVLVADSADEAFARIDNRLDVGDLQTAYRLCRDKKTFFTPFFDQLAGTRQLRKQIEQELPAEEIRKSWQPELDRFISIRRKYLLYAE